MVSSLPLLCTSPTGPTPGTYFPVVYLKFRSFLLSPLVANAATLLHNMSPPHLSSIPFLSPVYHSAVPIHYPSAPLPTMILVWTPPSVSSMIVDPYFQLLFCLDIPPFNWHPSSTLPLVTVWYDTGATIPSFPSPVCVCTGTIRAVGSWKLRLLLLLYALVCTHQV